MQSLAARSQYKHTFDCAYQTFTNDGITAFWRGSTPRLARLMVSPFNVDLVLGLIEFVIVERRNRIHCVREGYSITGRQRGCLIHEHRACT